MLKAPKVVRRVFTFITHGHKLIGISPDTHRTPYIHRQRRRSGVTTMNIGQRREYGPEPKAFGYRTALVQHTTLG